MGSNAIESIFAAQGGLAETASEDAKPLRSGRQRIHSPGRTVTKVMCPSPAGGPVEDHIHRIQGTALDIPARVAPLRMSDLRCRRPCGTDPPQGIAELIISGPIAHYPGRGTLASHPSNQGWQRTRPEVAHPLACATWSRHRAIRVHGKMAARTRLRNTTRLHRLRRPSRKRTQPRPAPIAPRQPLAHLYRELDLCRAGTALHAPTTEHSESWHGRVRSRHRTNSVCPAATIAKRGQEQDERHNCGLSSRFIQAGHCQHSRMRAYSLPHGRTRNARHPHQKRRLPFVGSAQLYCSMYSPRNAACVEESPSSIR